MAVTFFTLCNGIMPRVFKPLKDHYRVKKKKYVENCSYVDGWNTTINPKHIKLFFNACIIRIDYMPIYDVKLLSKIVFTK